MAVLHKWTLTDELDRFRSELNALLERLGFGDDFFGKRQKPAPGPQTNAIDELLERHLVGDFFARRNIMTRPAIETIVEDGKFTARVDLPGVSLSDVDIEVAGRVLTIKGRREKNNQPRKEDLFRREIAYGNFYRSIPLPEGTNLFDSAAGGNQSGRAEGSPLRRCIRTLGTHTKVQNSEN